MSFRIMSRNFGASILVALVLPMIAWGQQVEGWGRFVDPLGDCSVEESTGTLTITVPGSLHDLHTGMDAPRVVQEVSGDFVGQVCIRKFALPSKNSWADQRAPVDFVSSGLLIYLDDKNFVRFERTGSVAEKGPRVTVWGKFYREGKDVAYARHELPDQDLYLKIERAGAKIQLAYSGDAKTWNDFPLLRWREGESFFERPERNEEVQLKGRVQVGLYSINATKFPISHGFTDYRLLK